MTQPIVEFQNVSKTYRAGLLRRVLSMPCAT